MQTQTRKKTQTQTRTRTQTHQEWAAGGAGIRQRLTAPYCGGFVPDDLSLSLSLAPTLSPPILSLSLSPLLSSSLLSLSLSLSLLSLSLSLSLTVSLPNERAHTHTCTHHTKEYVDE